MFKHDAGENFEAGVDSQELQWKMKGEVDEGKPCVVRHSKNQRMVDLWRQKCHLETVPHTYHFNFQL